MSQLQVTLFYKPDHTRQVGDLLSLLGLSHHLNHPDEPDAHFNLINLPLVIAPTFLSDGFGARLQIGVQNLPSILDIIRHQFGFQISIVPLDDQIWALQPHFTFFNIILREVA